MNSILKKKDIKYPCRIQNLYRNVKNKISEKILSNSSSFIFKTSSKELEKKEYSIKLIFLVLNIRPINYLNKMQLFIFCALIKLKSFNQY